MLPTSGSANEVMDVGRSSGLAAIGTCGAEPFDGTRTVLEERRAAGLDAGMGFTYRNPARATDPRLALPERRPRWSVGAVAYHRRPPAPSPEHGPGRSLARGGLTPGSTTRSSSGRRSRRSRCGSRTPVAGGRVLIDDNGLVDREAAHRAGIGWFGKNANLLLPGRGSWFVLGSVRHLGGRCRPARAVVPDGCGACRRCLDGCPTGAIVAPGVIDANRCLSWLLQVDGDLPRAYAGRRSVTASTAATTARTSARRLGVAAIPMTTAIPMATLISGRSRWNARAPGATGTSRSWIDVGWLLTATDDEVMERVDRWVHPRARPAVHPAQRPGRARQHRTTRRPAVRSPGCAPTCRAGDDLLVGHAAWAATRARTGVNCSTTPGGATGRWCRPSSPPRRAPRPDR